MREPQLDERLRAVANCMPACDWAADIGADHGRLSCHLLQSGRCKHMLVSDISADSLAKARRLLALHGVAERAEFRVADGLDALTRPVLAAAICGMGGATIAKMLQRSPEKLAGAALVLSAHTDIPLVRETLGEIGYHIDEERLARAGGRFYIVIRALPGGARYTEKELLLGPALLGDRSPEWLAYLRWRRGVHAAMQNDDARHIVWIEEEIAHALDGTGGV